MIYKGTYQSSTCIFEIIIIFGRGFPRFKIHTDNTRVDWSAWCAERCFFLSFGHTTIRLSAAILKLFVHISMKYFALKMWTCDLRKAVTWGKQPNKGHENVSKEYSHAFIKFFNLRTIGIVNFFLFSVWTTLFCRSFNAINRFVGQLCDKCGNQFNQFIFSIQRRLKWFLRWQLFDILYNNKWLYRHKFSFGHNFQNSLIFWKSKRPQYIFCRFSFKYRWTRLWIFIQIHTYSICWSLWEISLCKTCKPDPFSAHCSQP